MPTLRAPQKNPAGTKRVPRRPRTYGHPPGKVPARGPRRGRRTVVRAIMQWKTCQNAAPPAVASRAPKPPRRSTVALADDQGHLFLLYTTMAEHLHSGLISFAVFVVLDHPTPGGLRTTGRPAMWRHVFATLTNEIKSLCKYAPMVVYNKKNAAAPSPRMNSDHRNL